MDSTTAVALIASLLERVGREHSIGVMSSLEQEALRLALLALQDLGAGTLSANDRAQTQSIANNLNGDGSTASAGDKAWTPNVELALSAIERDPVTDPKMLLCLDFGTAMSKAFAIVLPDQYLDLELGAATGSSGYAIPSTVFIGDDGKAYFGSEAVEKSEELVDSGRERLDSIKAWISLRHEGTLDDEGCVLSKAMNPTGERLTQGDMIRIYLAYLTDAVGNALARHGVSEPRYVKRRFARPCWPSEKQAAWADPLMRRMLSEAQILADTFSGRWKGGLGVTEMKNAVEQVKRLARYPEYLVEQGVPEPVAVAAGAFAGSENQRDAYLVVDAGAGTTDFGLFVSVHNPADGEHRVFQVPSSIHGLMQAGDKVDALLRTFIAQHDSIHSSDSSGKMIFADLARRIRGMKETLFKTGRLQYVLADGTVGEVDLETFLADEKVKRFAQTVEDGLKKSLESVDESWLSWLAMGGVSLRVVLTGGSSRVPMIQALSNGYVEVKGHRISRTRVDPAPKWMESMPAELQFVYPQLAVAIGGASETMPETLSAPPVFGGGRPQHIYVAGRLHVAGA